MIFIIVTGLNAERDTEKIAKIQENCFEDICNFLNIYPAFKI